MQNNFQFEKRIYILLDTQFYNIHVPIHVIKFNSHMLFH